MDGWLARIYWMGAGVVDPLLIGTDHLMYQTSYHLGRGQLNLPFLDWLMAYLSIYLSITNLATHNDTDQSLLITYQSAFTVKSTTATHQLTRR